MILLILLANIAFGYLVCGMIDCNIPGLPLKKWLESAPWPVITLPIILTFWPVIIYFRFKK